MLLMALYPLSGTLLLFFIFAEQFCTEHLSFQIMRHQYPLHRISYCADDKSDRRMLTFIAKAADTNEHFCYVFASEKSVRHFFTFVSLLRIRGTVHAIKVLKRIHLT